MKHESRPEETAPAHATRTVRRSPDAERVLLRIPLSRWLTPGLMGGFEEQVVDRLDHMFGSDVDLTLSPTKIFEEVEERALEMAAWLMLLAYHDDTGLMETHVQGLVSIVTCAQQAAMTARSLRDGRSGDAR